MIADHIVALACALIAAGLIIGYHLAGKHVHAMTNAALTWDEEVEQAIALCEPPIFAETWAYSFRAELEDDEQVARWLA